MSIQTMCGRQFRFKQELWLPHDASANQLLWKVGVIASVCSRKHWGQQFSKSGPQMTHGCQIQVLV